MNDEEMSPAKMIGAVGCVLEVITKYAAHQNVNFIFGNKRNTAISTAEGRLTLLIVFFFSRKITIKTAKKSHKYH